ncbi:MAG: family 20 glycosylhydrolase [Phycisphaerae bacterium]|nr:family 20 glycosylhydrolase [Phycisphaerae bacterium]
MLKKSTIVMLISFSILLSEAALANSTIVPEPQKVNSDSQIGFICSGVSISDPDLLLTSYSKRTLDQLFNKGDSTKAKPLIIKADKKIADEGYRIDFEQHGITITASTNRGVLWAIRTLQQLTGESDNGNGQKLFIFNINLGTIIQDEPAFGMRGFMEDVGRNYRPVSQLKELLEVMSRYKLNTFHFHLTDYPGWRVESDKYPELNAADNMRHTRLPGKYYTKAEIKELVQYAAERGIEIIPEMDMPGHSEYFTKTFGFEMQTEKGLEILKSQIAEWVELFPSPYFHIGSDEVRIKMKSFIPEIVKEVRKYGKKPIIWRPGAAPVDSEIVTQLWSGSGKPTGKNPYIDSRSNYLNHLDPLAGYYRLFFQQPCRTHKGDDKALGGIFCYWPDNAIAEPGNSLRIAAVYPSLVAYADTIWHGREKDYQQYWAKLPEADTEEYQDYLRFENRIANQKVWFAENNMPYQFVKPSQVQWSIVGPIGNRGKLDKAFSEIEKNPTAEEYQIDGKSYKWSGPIRGGTIHLNHFFGFDGVIANNKGNNTVYARSFVYSPKSQEVGFWLGFNSPSLAGGRRGAGVPRSGTWSNVGSDIFINGKRIDPPQWDNPGLVGNAGKEVPHSNDIYINRPTTKVKLNQGWNTILMRVSFGKWDKGSSWKWCFTAIAVDFDEQSGIANEVKGLRYSASKIR